MIGPHNIQVFTGNQTGTHVQEPVCAHWLQE
jgi:hypothetical protein